MLIAESNIWNKILLTAQQSIFNLFVIKPFPYAIILNHIHLI